jgi:hypothetical protein
MKEPGKIHVFVIQRTALKKHLNRLPKSFWEVYAKFSGYASTLQTAYFGVLIFNAASTLSPRHRGFPRNDVGLGTHGDLAAGISTNMLKQ